MKVKMHRKNAKKGERKGLTERGKSKEKEKQYVDEGDGRGETVRKDRKIEKGKR